MRKCKYYNSFKQQDKFYINERVNMKTNLDEIDRNIYDIKNTFDRLGIPEAEKKSLAGVGAQYDSEVVYHSIKQELVKL